MTMARLDDRVGGSSAEKILLRYQTSLWSLKEEVDWAAMAPEETERARDWLREIRDCVDVQLEQIAAQRDDSVLLADAIQTEQPEAKSESAPEVSEAMVNGEVSEAEKEKSLAGWETSGNNGEDAKPALKKCRGHRESKKTLKSLKELGNVLTGAFREAGKSATTDGEWITSKSGVRVKGGQ